MSDTSGVHSSHEPAIVVERLKERRRGPGGNWNSFVAYRVGGGALRGYGQTVREAQNDLRSKEDPDAFKP